MSLSTRIRRDPVATLTATCDVLYTDEPATRIGALNLVKTIAEASTREVFEAVPGRRGCGASGDHATAWRLSIAQTHLMRGKSTALVAPAVG